MSDFKVGDLVMVVKPKPCCGDARAIGDVFIIAEITYNDGTCNVCEDNSPTTDAWDKNDEGADIRTLIKIDPPAINDSLPTRKDIKEPA